VLPGMLLMVGVLYPFLTGVTWAFSHIGFNGVAHFTGLANFIDLFQPGNEGLQGLSTTLRYAVAAVAIQTVLGLSVALLLTWKARWTRVFRTLVIVPMLLPPVVATVMWKVMMVDRGVLDYFVNRSRKFVHARARDDDRVTTTVRFLGDAQEFSPVVLAEFHMEMLALDLQVPRLNEIVHVCKKPRSLGRSVSKREAVF